LIAALALLVVLSSAGAAMLRMTSAQQAGSTAVILGARAQWAARSGVEWALHEAVTSSGCPAPSTTLNLSGGVLSGFQVIVFCAATSHQEGAESRTSLSIRSEATFGVIGSLNHVYREVQASVVL
jgi:MSHA biogenesis protein MshP